MKSSNKCGLSDIMEYVCTVYGAWSTIDRGIYSILPNITSIIDTSNNFVNYRTRRISKDDPKIVKYKEDISSLTIQFMCKTPIESNSISYLNTSQMIRCELIPRIHDEILKSVYSKIFKDKNSINNVIAKLLSKHVLNKLGYIIHLDKNMIVDVEIKIFR